MEQMASPIGVQVGPGQPVEGRVLETLAVADDHLARLAAYQGGVQGAVVGHHAGHGSGLGYDPHGPVQGGDGAGHGLGAAQAVRGHGGRYAGPGLQRGRVEPRKRCLVADDRHRLASFHLTLVAAPIRLPRRP